VLSGDASLAPAEFGLGAALFKLVENVPHVAPLIAKLTA
jgi:hypothetical protein